MFKHNIQYKFLTCDIDVLAYIKNSLREERYFKKECLTVLTTTEEREKIIKTKTNKAFKRYIQCKENISKIKNKTL